MQAASDIFRDRDAPPAGPRELSPAVRLDTRPRACDRATGSRSAPTSRARASIGRSPTSPSATPTRNERAYAALADAAKSGRIEAEPTASDGPSTARLVAASRPLLRSCAGAPQADEPGHQGDEEELAGQHLEHGQDLADVAGGHEVAVSGRRQRGVAEEQVVAGCRVRDAGEDLAALQASEREEQVSEQQAEQNEDAHRPEDGLEVDVGSQDDAAQDRDRRDREQQRVDDERDTQQPVRGNGLCERSRDDRDHGRRGRDLHAPEADVGARERDDRGQAGDGDCGNAAAPALRRQRQRHDEGDEDQDENQPVGIEDPLDELEPRFADRPRPEPTQTRTLWWVAGHTADVRPYAMPSCPARFSPFVPALAARLLLLAQRSGPFAPGSFRASAARLSLSDVVPSPAWMSLSSCMSPLAAAEPPRLS